MSQGKILVADDDQALVRTLTYILREKGYEVRTLDGGEQLLSAIEEDRPDLLLLDIMMPRIDGLRLLEQLKSDARWRDLPVLMISSMPPEEATVRSLGLGAADFISKPFRVGELVARVQAQLKASRDLRVAREEARSASRDLSAAREEARSSAELADILHEITDTLKPDEIYHVLTRRVARVLNLSRCSVVVAGAGDPEGVVVAAYENPMLRNLRVSLDRYPEIQQALDSNKVVLVEDVWTHPLYEAVRRRWDGEQIDVTTRSCIAVPFAGEHSQTGVFFLRATRDDRPLTQSDADFADGVVKAAVAAIDKAHSLEVAVAARDRLEKLAATDPLTGCVNRRGLSETLDLELERARRYDQPLAILLADLDRFKIVNDSYGHLVGDSVLRQVGELLRHEVRSADVVARYGGEEFVIVMPQTATEGALHFAERIRERIERHDFAQAAGAPLHLTISVGVACYPHGRIVDVDSFISLADQALYRAKHGGRNLVREVPDQ